eukprot:13208-Heterococcus_DN1.PRE.1
MTTLPLQALWFSNKLSIASSFSASGSQSNSTHMRGVQQTARIDHTRRKAARAHRSAHRTEHDR